MLPAGAFAVILMLGGSQIMLPAPAFVEQGRVWAPAREVLQRVGCKVRWQAEDRSLIVSRAGRDLTFPQLPPPWPVPATVEAARYARRSGNYLYVPLLALRDFGLKSMWEPRARRVVIRDPLPIPVALASVLNNPAQWLGRTVVVTGDYLGWDAYPFCYATRPGPPVASGDWILANEGGAIYCTPAPEAPAPARAGLAVAREVKPLLTPYAALGHRLSVEGAVALSAAGVPHLRFTRVETVTGAVGVSCHLMVNQRSCVPGATLSWELVIHNPGPTDLTVQSSGEMHVSVADAAGGVYVDKQSSPRLTSSTVVPAADELRLPGAWPVPESAPPGLYTITVIVSDSIRSYAEHFEVALTKEAWQP